MASTPDQNEPGFFQNLKQDLKLYSIRILGIFEFKPETRTGKALIGTVAVTVLLGVSVYSVRKIHWTSPPPSAIHVFLPDPASSSDEAFYEDGVIQKRGFDRAIQNALSIPNRFDVRFHEMRREETPQSLIKKMQDLYETDGATYFVMTMSGKVGDLHDHFTTWHKDCKRRHDREPILIATVASAPQLADAAGGILRWYVRSEEESSLLAEFMRWKLGVTHAAAFFITRNPQLADDTYGKSGMDLFTERFMALGGSAVAPFNVTATTAKAQVRKFLDQIRNASSKTPRSQGVFIVGYGDMVRETISELLANGFSGPILCTSTLTEPDWQPKDSRSDGRIYTVFPRLIERHDRLQGDDRNVVFFFAKNTLYRVLRLTANDPDPSTFVDRWRRDEDKQDKQDRQPLDQEYLANGDIIVQLEVVGSSSWR